VKMLIAAVSVMWVALAVELAMPKTLAHGSLLLPIVCGVMFWTRSTSGLIVSGLVLLLDSIARPLQLPLSAMFLPFIAVSFLAPSIHSEEYRARGCSFRVPAPLQLPLLTLAAVLLQSVGSIPLDQYRLLLQIFPIVFTSVKAQAMVALPMSACLSLMIRFGDELGLRRSFV
jgi:hypothetical protein